MFIRGLGVRGGGGGGGERVFVPLASLVPYYVCKATHASLLCLPRDDFVPVQYLYSKLEFCHA